MTHRAYSLFELKTFDADRREVTGIASTPSTDRVGDVVEPKGVQFKLPIPLLWQHNSAEPIGQVTAAKVSQEGIEVQAKLARSDTPGKLKDRLDEAWDSLRIGLVRGLSIGFRVLESTPIESGLRIAKWEWLELSAVTIPANADASISQVKFFAQEIDTSELYSPATMQAAKRVLGTLGKMSLKKQAQVNEILLALVMTQRKRLGDLVRDQKSIEYRGTWTKQMSYSRGNFVTHAGSVWHCNAFDVTSRPGTASDWTLAVKKGKDGR